MPRWLHGGPQPRLHASLKYDEQARARSLASYSPRPHCAQPKSSAFGPALLRLVTDFRIACAGKHLIAHGCHRRAQKRVQQAFADGGAASLGALRVVLQAGRNVIGRRTGLPRCSFIRSARGNFGGAQYSQTGPGGLRDLPQEVIAASLSEGFWLCVDELEPVEVQEQSPQTGGWLTPFCYASDRFFQPDP